MKARSVLSVAITTALLGGTAGRADEELRHEATAAIRRAITYYRQSVATHGGYVYYYSPDLKRRWGEGQATADQIWVQPPGTPTVGMAFLRAFEATGERAYLAAATEAAEALVYGQLKSGGWTNCIDFDPNGARLALYRNGRGRGKNNSTLDDGISQGAIQLLVRVDEALEFKQETIHGAARRALEALLAAQFAHGGFPQVWTRPVPAVQVLSASMPTYDWRTEGRIKNYWDMPTLNDQVAGTVFEALSCAYRVYERPEYLEALEGLGDFLVLAQLPEPQPAWAQQYNLDMKPIWARRFEPAAVTGSESQDVLETLIKIYQHTGEEKYLEPIPGALDYLERSTLPDGRLARYYELHTNRPLYMKRQGAEYSLTHDDSNLPSHYGWKVASRIASIRQSYELARSGDRRPPRGVAVDQLAEEVREILADLDTQGRWISRYAGEPLVGQPKFSRGEAYLASEVFSRNLTRLSEYLVAADPSGRRVRNP